MIKGIYTSASAMRTGIARQDITANNLANANTTGFKRDRLFVSELIQAGQNPQEKTLLESVEAARFVEFTPGSLEPTGSDLDFAIQGEGFFEITGENGPLYTRNGRFLRNEEGILVDASGRAVQGEGGEISLPEGLINVTGNGEISVNGTIIDKFKVVNFDSLQLLNKEAGTAFSDPDGRAGQIALDNAVVRQGFLEGSNVETMQEMVEMISTARNYEMNARLLSTQDQTLQKTVNEIGRV
ncbi:flagellar basal-body rod protein FlgF [bacterium]|nr:flagellar basal-body rod protein FlgF [bacterium]MBU1638463.1 flagellar basal-body rod protein FlgF [bacterium]MBU1921482.1 flagellar basal-body rod protein FlgF [bacterium]